MRAKYLSIEHEPKVKDLPNFSKSGSIIGMKKKYYGKDALLVTCGQYIYNVTSRPEIYHNLAYQY